MARHVLIRSHMNVRKLLVLSAVVTTAFVSQPASAGPVDLLSSEVGGAPAFAVRVNFDVLPVPGGEISVAFTGDAAAVTGTSSSQYAAPFLSGGNGLGFGLNGTDQADGANTTQYLTTGTGSVTLTFTNEQKFFGLLWGSVDNYNTLSFYNGNQLLASFTGLQVKANANGSQAEDGTVYANFNSTGFTKVVATSTQNAFEFDNVSYSERQASVPDGGTTLALLGLGLTGMGLLRRRIR